MWPTETIKAMNKKKTEPLFSCYHCGKTITSEESYFEIYHYVPHEQQLKRPKPKNTRKQFHEACFEEIAGKVYAS